jgi:lysozyme
MVTSSQSLNESSKTMIDETAITDRLVKDEDEVLHAYEDHLGFWTIGVGRLIDQRRGGGISREESCYLLRNDIDRRLMECSLRFPWFIGLDVERRGVIICMAFQLGTNGVSNFRKMCTALEQRDYVEASEQMLDSAWAITQAPARARRLSRIMLTGVWE